MSASSGAEATARDISERYGVLVLPVLADVSSESEVEAMFSRVESEFGAPHILVNNAGVCPVKMIADTSYAEWRRVMDINVGGVFLTSRAFLKSRMASGGGRIVNIASQSAYNGSRNGKTHYAASKGAVVSFTVSFAKEAAAYGVAVNAVSPGHDADGHDERDALVPGSAGAIRRVNPDRQAGGNGRSRARGRLSVQRRFGIHDRQHTRFFRRTMWPLTRNPMIRSTA